MWKEGTIGIPQPDGEWITHYDRGWDIEPACKEAEICLSILLNAYN